MLEFLDGNEAVARAAVDAGCKFFAGYPITPATQILLEMMRLMPANDGFAIQAEDEIASIGFCIAASMTGKKSMTATSGPGISLYSENIGLAIMGETPLVIVDVQRHGPATGSATKDGASDIQFIRWGTSGGYPIIALSPSSVPEAYTYTIYAFNLAEIFRTPVFLISSKEIAITRERFDWSNVEKPAVIDRVRFNGNGKFLPYNFKKLDDIPAFLEFGREHIVRYTTSTHGKDGELLTNPDKIQEMMDHLNQKIDEEKVCRYFPHAVSSEEVDTDVVIVAYGITARSALEAVNIARSLGKNIKLIKLGLLWPCPEKQLLQAIGKARTIVIPEMNNGQYSNEIERIVKDKQIIKVNQMDTKLISPHRILNAINSEIQW